MNPSDYERAMYEAPVPTNRAARRARAQIQGRAERSQRRSRARIEQALGQFQKETSS